MGFWDREVRSSFDRVFDYDGDGYLNTSERACQFSYIEDRKRKENDDDDDWDEFDSDF